MGQLAFFLVVGLEAKRELVMGQLHHVVYRITDGADDDWASFYANWLIDHSELSETLGRASIRSHLVRELVESERAFNAAAPPARWQDSYAERIVDRFG